MYIRLLYESTTTRRSDQQTVLLSLVYVLSSSLPLVDESLQLRLEI